MHNINIHIRLFNNSGTNNQTGYDYSYWNWLFHDNSGFLEIQHIKNCAVFLKTISSFITALMCLEAS